MDAAKDERYGPKIEYARPPADGGNALEQLAAAIRSGEDAVQREARIARAELEDAAGGRRRLPFDAPDGGARRG